MVPNDGRGGRGRRRTGTLPSKPLVHVACEGKSEQSYVAALVDHRYHGKIALKHVVRGSLQGKRTSVLSLIKELKRYERDRGGHYERGQHLWLICDSDPGSNAAHAEELAAWIDAEHHHAAISSNSLEGWLLAHFTDIRPSSPGRAADELIKHLPKYKKGMTLGADVISRTDEACARERRHYALGEPNGVWPPERCSQMPDFIAFLDELAARAGWSPN